jgi:hypothetical protein
MATLNAEILQAIAQTVAAALHQSGLGVGAVQQSTTKTKNAIDTKAVRIRDFDGSSSSWEAWVHSFKSAIRSTCPEALTIMEEAEKATMDATDDNLEEYTDVEKISAEVYNILSQYCTGEALTLVKAVTTFEGFLAWQKLFRKYNPKTMARAIRLMSEVASPKQVKEMKDIDEAITTWENKVKRLESEYDEKLSQTMKVAVVTGMMPMAVQDFIYTNIDDGTKYDVMVARIRSWAANKLAMMDGPIPMDIGEVDMGGWSEEGREWDEAQVQAIGPNAQCYRCGGWGHMSRECPTAPGKAKGKGKDNYQGKGKGFAKGVGGKGQTMNYGKGAGTKGKGRGYQGSCWQCGVVGHKANECMYNRQANMVEENAGENVDIGGIWMIGHVDADEWVAVPPGLGRKKREPRTSTRASIFKNNRFEALASKENEQEEVEDAEWHLFRRQGKSDKESCTPSWGQECFKEVGVNMVGVEAKKSRESGMRFNVARVQKPLASAAKVVEAGNKISMGPKPEDNFIEHGGTGEKIALRVEKGTYVFDVEFQNGEVGAITLDSGAGVNVWPEGLLREVPMMPKDPRLKMTAANGSNIENLGTKFIKFRGFESGFTRRAPVV